MERSKILRPLPPSEVAMELNTDFCNKALAHIAHGIQIADVETEPSKEALTCKLFFPDVVAELARDDAFPKHRVTGALAQVDNPSSEWGFAYRQPADCVLFRRILNGQRGREPNAGELVVPHEFTRDSAGPIILTDMPSAIGEWVILVEDPTRWDADVYLAGTFLLASYIAVAITGGDQAKLGARALEMYTMKIGKARAKALNEVQRKVTTSSGMSRARGHRGHGWSR